MNWLFFVTGLDDVFLEYAIAHRLAERERVVTVGCNVSVIRSPGRLPFGLRVFPMPEAPYGTYYRSVHFPTHLPLVGTLSKGLNVAFFRKEIERILTPEPWVVCYDSPMRHNLTDVLIDHFSVYYATDDLTVNIVGDTLSDDVEAERHLLSKMNLVICNNDELARRLRERFPSSRRPPIRVLPNFYDERIFNPNKTYPEPPGLHNVPTPRILVAGHISERLDWDGIAAASELRPHWTWVFLSRGTAPGMKKNIYGKLGSRGYWHPAVPLGEVPAWIRSCDGCAVPYRLNSFTLASDPTKATEYLAMGAPVLSTRVPALARYDQAVAWVEEGDGESYVSALDILARQSGNQELKMLRQKAVAGESLNTRVSQFQKTVLSHANP